MPFNQLLRRESYPPTIVRLRGEEGYFRTSPTREDIDADPFSFFLTTPDEDDLDVGIELDLEEELSAGIEPSSTSSSISRARPIIQEISASSFQRRPLLDSSSDEDDDEEYMRDLTSADFGLPLSLRDFASKHIKHFTPRIKPTIPQILIEEDEPEEVRPIPSSPRTLTALGTRGRGIVRLSPSTQNGRGRGRARSLSAQRSRSWREPSPDVYSIPEEDEGESPSPEVVADPLSMDSSILNAAADQTVEVGPAVPAKDDDSSIQGVACAMTVNRCSPRLEAQRPRPKKRVSFAPDTTFEPGKPLPYELELEHKEEQRAISPNKFSKKVKWAL